MDDYRKQSDFTELALLAVNGEATRQQIELLDRILKTEPAMVPVYVVLLDLYTELSEVGSVEISPKTIDAASYDTFLQLLSEEEKAAPTIEIERPEEVVERQLIQKIEYQRPVRTINRFSLVTAVLCAAAVLLMIIYIQFAPPASYEVATVSDSMDAQWSSGLPIEPGTRILSDSKLIRLTRGIVTLKTDDQVRIVLEAPTEFCFSSFSEVSMNYGRLFACVSEQGYGFSVVTPNSKIVDLGTEFGVIAHIDGNTEVLLYKGKANVFAGERQERKISKLLTAGLAVKVDSHNSHIQDIALDKQALVRNIVSKAKLVWRGPKALRLADLLLGGNGFGTASQQKIEYDPTTGAAVPVGDAGYREGLGMRVDVPESPYLDAIFIPGSGDTDAIISSAGHRFEECPTTSGLYFSNVICQKNGTFFGSVQQTFEKSAKQFTDSGSLYLHSNMGLTVDLDAVRREVSGLQLASFSAFAGIMNMWNNAEVPDYAEVDVWVLVDGQIRSSRQKLRADQGYDIHVEIADEDHFLTLVVTDGGKIYSDGDPANHFDTCGFSEPVFELNLP
ncbi:MAG: FecR domain-containing protein [Planctomycetes bacterium]|nr:FecR domain-containing protein [Planctomycetota bacterium]